MSTNGILDTQEDQVRKPPLQRKLHDVEAHKLENPAPTHKESNMADNDKHINDEFIINNKKDLEDALNKMATKEDLKALRSGIQGDMLAMLQGAIAALMERK